MCSGVLTPPSSTSSAAVAFRGAATAEKASARASSGSARSEVACPGRAVMLFPHHHVGGLDHRPGLVADLEAELVYRLVGDRGGEDDAAANIDPHMRRRLSLAGLDNLALELIARAELLHVVLRTSFIGRLLRRRLCQIGDDPGNMVGTWSRKAARK